MRVALDATPLTLSTGGLRRYTEQLSCALAELFPRDVFSLISDQAFPIPCHWSNLRQGALPHTRLERKWWLCGASLAMRRLHAQLFHGTNFEVPYLNFRPSVVTIHDLSPWKDPAWHSDADRVRARAPWLLHSGIATVVITPSEAMRREVIAYFGLAPERVIAVPLAAVTLPAAEPVSCSGRPYFLFAGTIEPRKNLEMLIDAWRAIRVELSVGLVLAGRRREDGLTIPIEPGLEALGEVTDAQLASLYRGAIALIYPSHYEGFGLPVLEAMRCGTAVVISHDPALIEVAGDAALRVGSARDLASVMRALVQKPALRETHRAASLRRSAQFTWARTAAETRAVYGEALARFG